MAADLGKNEERKKRKFCAVVGSESAPRYEELVVLHHARNFITIPILGVYLKRDVFMSRLNSSVLASFIKVTTVSRQQYVPHVLCLELRNRRH